MPIALLPTLLLQILIVGFTPGPGNIYALAMSLRHDRKTVLRMWCGLLCGFATAVILVAVCTHFIGIALGTYVRVLKYGGAAYILYLAGKIVYGRPKASGQQGDCTFWSGYMVQLTNAKMILFDLTIFSTFVFPTPTDCQTCCIWDAFLLFQDRAPIWCGYWRVLIFAVSLKNTSVRSISVRLSLSAGVRFISYYKFSIPS